MLKPTLVCLLPLAAAFGFAQDSIDLRMHPKQDEVRKYTMNISAQVGALVNIEIVGLTTVKSVQDNGDYTYESKITSQKMLVDSVEQKQDIRPPATCKRSSHGMLLANSIPDGANRISQLTQFGRFLMLKDDSSVVGSSWDVKVDASDKLGIFGATATYKFAAKEQLDNLDVGHLTLDYKDVDGVGTAKGDIWVRLTDGTVVKSELTFDKLTISDAIPPGSGKISIKLAEG
jgi:hypothetical protein